MVRQFLRLLLVLLTVSVSLHSAASAETYIEQPKSQGSTDGGGRPPGG